MKIGIMSDSHHHLNAIDEAICLAPDVECWLHAGDNISDTEYLATVSGVPVYGVCGNTDGFSNGPQELLITLAGFNILLLHGHRHAVKFDLNELIVAGEQQDAKLVIYGHTHIGNLVELPHMTIANPGSVAEPRDGLPPSFMVADIHESMISLRRIYLK